MAKWINKDIEEHLKKFPSIKKETVYSETAVDYLHRNPGLTPGIFCMGDSHIITYYNTKEIEKWLEEFKEKCTYLKKS